MSNLQTYCRFKLDFQKVDQHTGGTCLFHGTKRYITICVNTEINKIYIDEKILLCQTYNCC